MSFFVHSGTVSGHAESLKFSCHNSLPVRRVDVIHSCGVFGDDMQLRVVV